MKDAAITASIPAGEDVPGTAPFRTAPGVSVPAKTASIEIGGETMEQEIPGGAPSVTFKLKLEKGPAELTAMLPGPEGEKTGAYDAYVKKL